MSIYNIDGTPLNIPYSKTGLQLEKAYNIDGEIVFSESVNYDAYSFETLFTPSVPNMQGFDIFDDYIFQFRASSSLSNIMCTIDMDSGSILQNNITAKSDHGDSASFSDEYYDENDPFPLLYVTSDTTPCKVYVNRVTTTSSELIKTLLFPLAKAGYYAAHAYDVGNEIMYIVGYSENNYQSDNDGSNKTLVSVWDMNDLTDNGDGTFTPEFIRSFTRTFIYVMQGQQFHDGMIWIASGYGNKQSYIYAISPVDGRLLHTVDLNTTTEVEGMSFISPNEMVVGFQGGTYKKYTFATN